MIAFIAVTCIFFMASGAWAEQAPQKIIDLANSELASLGTHPTIVGAVKAENAKGKSLADIKAMDAKWKATPGIADYMEALMDSECAAVLLKTQKTTPFYAEVLSWTTRGPMSP